MDEVVSQISKEYGKAIEEDPTQREQMVDDKIKSQQESDEEGSSQFESYKCINSLKVEIRVKDESNCNYEFSEKDAKHSMRVENPSKQINLSDDEEQPLVHRTLRHKCPHCIKSFATYTLLDRHLTMHENKTKLCYVCHICDEQFPNISKLKNHITNNHDTAQNFSSSDNKKEDKKNSKFSCHVCSKQFTYQKSFNAHAKTHVECNREDTSDEDKSIEQEKIPEANLQDIDKTDEVNTESNLQCLQCGKIFATKRNLKRHISTHDGLKFDCPTCGKGFSRMDKLKDHEKSKHKEGLFGLTDDEENDDTDNEQSETSKKVIINHLFVETLKIPHLIFLFYRINTIECINVRRVRNHLSNHNHWPIIWKDIKGFEIPKNVFFARCVVNVSLKAVHSLHICALIPVLNHTFVTYVAELLPKALIYNYI